MLEGYFDAQFSSRGSESTAAKIASHITTLKELYVLECVSGWDAPVRSKSRVRTKPKYYFADPSLAATLLQVTPERLLEDGQLLGMLFESLAMHDLAVYHKPAEKTPAS